MGETDIIMCQHCKEAVAVDVHHIVYKGSGGSKQRDVIENLIGLCRKCHNLAHRKKIHILRLQRIIKIATRCRRVKKGG